MQRRFAPVVLIAFFASAIACNALTGVGDLDVDDEATTSPVPDASPLIDSAPAVTSSSSTASSASSSSSSGDVDAATDASSSSSSSSSSGNSSSSSSSSSGSSSSSSSSSSGSVIVDAGADASKTPTTVFSEGFESSAGSSAAPCDGWTINNSDEDYDTDTEPHSGKQSCEICSDSATAVTLSKTFTVTAAGELTASAWFEGEGVSTPSEIDLTVGNTTVSGYATIESPTRFQQIIATPTVAVTAGATVKVAIGITKGAISGPCVEMDDVLVTLQTQ